MLSSSTLLTHLISSDLSTQLSWFIVASLNGTNLGKKAASLTGVPWKMSVHVRLLRQVGIDVISLPDSWSDAHRSTITASHSCFFEENLQCNALEMWFCLRYMRFFGFVFTQWISRQKTLVENEIGWWIQMRQLKLKLWTEAMSNQNNIFLLRKLEYAREERNIILTQVTVLPVSLTACAHHHFLHINMDRKRVIRECNSWTHFLSFTTTLPFIS